MLCWVAWEFARRLGESRSSWWTTRHRVEGLAPADPGGRAAHVPRQRRLLPRRDLGGQVAWRGARQRAALAARPHDRAPGRLAAAARRRRRAAPDRARAARRRRPPRVGDRGPGRRRPPGPRPRPAPRPAGALGAIEESSREAVTQMRSLLGTLRDIEAHRGGRRPAPSGSRTAEPWLADLAGLVASRDGDGLGRRTSRSRTPGRGRRLPAPVGLSLYRTAQEALANVTRHSTAGQRLVSSAWTRPAHGPFAEVEVLDDGRPRPERPAPASGCSASGSAPPPTAASPRSVRAPPVASGSGSGCRWRASAGD